MKKILLILLPLATLSAHDQWIQVFSGDVVEQRFLQTIGNNGYESIVIQENGLSTVLIGAYISKAEASKHLKEVRCNIAEDAYLRQYHYYSAESNSTAEIARDKNSTIINNTSEDCKPVACVCPKDQKHKRELEIGSALEFYKNSGHYHFEEK